MHSKADPFYLLCSVNKKAESLDLSSPDLTLSLPPQLLCDILVEVIVWEEIEYSEKCDMLDV